MREPCHPFYRGDICLQETILWGFHPCQETFGRDGQKLNLIQLQAPLHPHLKQQCHPEKWDLTMVIFVEHVHKLTIKFLSLFNF